MESGFINLILVFSYVATITSIMKYWMRVYDELP